MSITLDLPADMSRRLVEDRVEAEATLHRELAIAFYAKGELSTTQAANLAGMDRWAFADLLRQREIPLPWLPSTLDEEFSHVRGSC